MNTHPENPAEPSAHAAMETREASQRVRSDDGSAIEIPAGWHQIHEGNRVALGDRVWNGRRYTDLTAILGCEKVARGQTVIRNVQMHRAQNGHGPNSFTADGWRTMSPATQQALGEMVRRVTSPNVEISHDRERRTDESKP